MNHSDFAWEFNDSIDDIDYSVNSALMSAIKNYSCAIVSIGGDSSQTPPTVTPTVTPIVTPTPSIDGYIHNFTTDGKESDFFTIEGNLSTSKGTVVYNGLTLTQCLKMETVTSITFTTTQDLSLTLVFNLADGKKVKVDGTKYEMQNGIINLPLMSGEHSITKADVANLYYIELK